MTLQLKVRRVEIEHIISILLVVEIYNAYQNLGKYRALRNLNSYLESCLKSVCGPGLVHLEQAAF